MNELKSRNVLEMLLVSAVMFTAGCNSGLPAMPGGAGSLPIPLPRPIGIASGATQVASRTVSLRPGACGAPAPRVGAPPLVDTTSRPGTTLLRDPGTGEVVGSAGAEAPASAIDTSALASEPMDLGIQAP